MEPLENNVSPEHPLAELGTLALGIALIGVGFLAVVWLAVEIAVRWLPATLEQRAFPDVTAEDPRAQAVGALAERLARHWPDHAYRLRVGVLEAAEPNAFAVPGGQLLVTSALLDGARSENELAFVVAHELGHVAGRDPLRALGRGLLVSLALAAVGQDEGATVAVSAAELGERSYSREQESAADRFALGLVEAEYGHVGGATDFFRRLGDGNDGGWLATHPRSADRVAELERLAAERGWPAEGELTPLPAGLRRD